jgi:hypothetical protein
MEGTRIADDMREESEELVSKESMKIILDELILSIGDSNTMPTFLFRISSLWERAFCKPVLSFRFKLEFTDS